MRSSSGMLRMEWKMKDTTFTVDQVAELRAIEKTRMRAGKLGLRDEVQKLIVRLTSSGVATQPLGKDEHLVHVDYASWPFFSELEKEFGEGNVSGLFDGREWQNHPSCANDQTPGGKIFLVKGFNKRIRAHRAIAEMRKLGYRPATHLEAYAFQGVNPDLQCQFRIVAPGSFVVDGDCRHVAVLDNGSHGRIFDSVWGSQKWLVGDRFLFVRKAS